MLFVWDGCLDQPWNNRCNRLDRFAEGTPDDLPPARREKYVHSGRNSKVLVKKLAKI